MVLNPARDIDQLRSLFDKAILFVSVVFFCTSAHVRYDTKITSKKVSESYNISRPGVRGHVLDEEIKFLADQIDVPCVKHCFLFSGNTESKYLADKTPRHSIRMLIPNSPRFIPMKSISRHCLISNVFYSTMFSRRVRLSNHVKSELGRIHYGG